MGHLSVAADDYLLTGQVGGGPGRQGRAGGAAPGLRDLWQVSAARFPDRSSGLEFIWVTVTGGVCCDKRLMGRALGSCLDTCGVGGRGAGLPSLPLPRARPSLTLPGHPVQGRCGGLFCQYPSSQNCSPQCPPSSCAAARGTGNIDHLPWAELRSCFQRRGTQG